MGEREKREAGRGGGERGEKERRGGEGSGESTAEEVDVPSSTTTDTLPEVSEPVDFIECGHALPRTYCTSALPHNGHGRIPRVITSSGLQVLCILMCSAPMNMYSVHAVAQLVELQPRTLKVVGSNPTWGSNISLKCCWLVI